MKTKLELGKNVKGDINNSMKVWDSVYYSVDSSLVSSVIGLINDSVWASLQSSVNISISRLIRIRLWKQR